MDIINDPKTSPNALAVLQYNSLAKEHIPLMPSIQFVSSVKIGKALCKRADFDQFPKDLKNFLKFHPHSSVRNDYFIEHAMKDKKDQEKVLNGQENDLYDWLKEQNKDASKPKDIEQEKLSRKAVLLKSKNLNPDLRDRIVNNLTDNQKNNYTLDELKTIYLITGDLGGSDKGTIKLSSQDISNILENIEKTDITKENAFCIDKIMSEILKLDNGKNLDAMERVAAKIMSFRLANAQEGATDLSKALVKGMAHVLDPKNYRENPNNNLMINKLKSFADRCQGDKQNILLEIAKITNQFNLADFSKEDLKNFSIDIAEAISSNKWVFTIPESTIIADIKNAYKYLQPSIEISSLIGLESGSEYLEQFKALFNSNIHSFDWNKIASELSNFKQKMSEETNDMQNHYLKYFYQVKNTFSGPQRAEIDLKISILEKMGAELPQTNTHTTYKEVVLDAKKIDFWNSKSRSINLDSLKNAYEQTYDFSKLFSGETPQEAKKTYHKLSLLFHPDRNPNNLEMATFFSQKINEAYESFK